MATKISENLAAVAPDGIVPDEPAARDVIEALQRVMRDLPGIGKGEKAAAQQGGYAYRGIEQITREAQVLFARHGVTFVPEVQGYEIREVTVGGKPWTDTILTVAYTVYGPGGINRPSGGLAAAPNDDCISVGPFVAIGRDGADKGANKAMTQAFKYALLQVLCISDKADDADQGSPEAEPRNQRSAVTRDQGPMRSPEGEVTSSRGNVRRGPEVLEGYESIEDQRAQHAAARALLEDLPDDIAAQLTAWRKDNDLEGVPMPKAQLDAVVAKTRELLAAPM